LILLKNRSTPVARAVEIRAEADRIAAIAFRRDVGPNATPHCRRSVRRLQAEADINLPTPPLNPSKMILPKIPTRSIFWLNGIPCGLINERNSMPGE
jgi:hypothetical protein